MYIESYPIKRCEIVEIGEVIYNAKTSYTVAIKNSNIIDSIQNHATNESMSMLNQFLRNEAISKGYNGILGVKYETQSVYNPTSDLSVVNGLVGMIIATNSAHGTPVKIKCNK